jgi:G6PDH family F420-dependent oxidoreductase
MTRFGVHASHEQVPPAQLLADVQRAEQAGFEVAMCSDHFSPWSHRQGHSAFSRAWLGAALATTGLTWGTVSAPGQRYHPAILAQAIGTLGCMFPGRFWVALGSGEASNEHVTGERWPRTEVRVQRVKECVQIIRTLLEGEEVSHDGLVTVDRARLWEVPDRRPRLERFIDAFGEQVLPELKGA